MPHGARVHARKRTRFDRHLVVFGCLRTGTKVITSSDHCVLGAKALGFGDISTSILQDANFPMGCIAHVDELYDKTPCGRFS